MAFGLNEVVGDYECLAIVSKPRSGLTYKVRNRTTGEIEALRALPGAASRDSESVERLLREIRIQTRLTHPNVIAFHDAFELDGQLVMTTDYVEGPTLAELCRGGPLPPARAIGSVCDVLAALEEAHALGIVHRGVSAENVIVGADGAVKLGGFDLAKPANDTQLTKVGAVIGDPRYMAPERILGKGDSDPRSDLYSAGVLLYLSLTGRLPFDGASDIDVLSAHVGTEPPRPAAVKPGIAAGVEAVLLKALRKNPDERFGSAREFREALAAALNALSVSNEDSAVLPAGPPAPTPEPIKQRSFAKPLIFASMAMAALAMLGWVLLR